MWEWIKRRLQTGLDEATNEIRKGNDILRDSIVAHHVPHVRALLNCSGEQAERILRHWIARKRSPQQMIDLLAMGWSYRESLGLNSRGMTAQALQQSNTWPTRLKPKADSGLLATSKRGRSEQGEGEK